MLNEKRIRQMTQLARYEIKEKKKSLAVGKYFRSDYIGISLLKNFFITTFGYFLILGVLAVYHMEWLMEEFDSINLVFLAGCLIGGYVVLLAFYSVVVYAVASAKYAAAKRSRKGYAEKLGELQKEYEAADRRNRRERRGRERK